MTHWIPWLIWGLAGIISFALIEEFAIRHRDRTWTLSLTMATLGANFPLTLVIFGIIMGALSVHFFGGNWNCGGGMGPG